MPKPPPPDPASDLPRGIGQPATRALKGAGITTLEGVSGASEAALLALHGFGPRAIRVLRDALAERGLSFSDERRA